MAIKGKRKGLEIFNSDGRELHRLYNTIIVERDSDRVTLNTGGWETNHTKNCMNDFLSDFGIKVSQVKFKWYVTGPNNTLSFEDGKVSFSLSDL